MRAAFSFLALILIAALTISSAPLQSQSSSSQAAAHAADAPTFYHDVLPILEQHCQGCHRTGEIGPMPLVTYDQVRPLARAVADSARQRRMPPWFADPGVGHFLNDPSLSSGEIETLEAWAKSIAPAGDPRDA